MKQALVTMAISDEYKQIGNDFTLPIMKDYCKRYGLDFVYADHCKSQHSPEVWKNMVAVGAWENFNWAYETLGTYDRIIFTHVDVILHKGAAHILAMLPPGKFYGFDEYPFDPDPCRHFLIACGREHPDEFPNDDFAPIMFSTGIYVCDKEHREVFRAPKVETAQGMLEMSLMNRRLHKLGIPYENKSPNFFNLSHEWEDGHGEFPPSFLHVMWQKGSKYDEVKRFMGRMGW